MIGNIVAGLQDPGFVAVGDFDSIATVTVGAGGAADVEFTSISSIYQHLEIRGICRSTATAGTTDGINLRFNSDTGSNYSVHQLSGNGSSATSVGVANTSVLQPTVLPVNTTTANCFSGVVITILDYADVNKYKTIRGLGGVDLNGSGQVTFGSSAWRSTSAVTSIKIFAATGNLVEHSTFALYGIKG